MPTFLAKVVTTQGLVKPPVVVTCATEQQARDRFQAFLEPGDSLEFRGFLPFKMKRAFRDLEEGEVVFRYDWIWPADLPGSDPVELEPATYRRVIADDGKRERMSMSRTNNSSPAPRRESSIRTYLLLLVGAVLAPMLALAAALAWYYAGATHQTISTERLAVATNLTNLLEREIGSMSGFLEGLGSAEGFIAGDQRAVDAATRMAQARGFLSLSVFDAYGRLLFTSPAGAIHAPPTAESIGAPLSVATGRTVVSSLQTNLGLKPGVFFISAPVSTEGRPTVVISGSIPPSRLQGVFAEAGLREGWRAGIVDQSGVIVARSREPELYVGVPAQLPMLQAAKGGSASGLFDVVTRDGVDVRNAFQRSAASGWTAAVAVPASVELAPYWSTAVTLSVAGISLLLIGLILALLIASRITHAVHTIGRAVVAFVTGDSVPLPSETLFELRDVLRLIESVSVMGRKGAYIKR